MNPNKLVHIPAPQITDAVAQGDCVELMRRMPATSMDFILTDPPYLVNYRSRDGRTIRNDADDRWLTPAFAEAYRVLRWNRFCVCFYGWSKADKFLAAWRIAGFRPVGHLVFRKSYASTTRFLRYQHEQAYLLAKGRPVFPEHPIPDVLEMRYSGNQLHPTQKPVSALLPLIESFSRGRRRSRSVLRLRLHALSSTQPSSALHRDRARSDLPCPRDTSPTTRGRLVAVLMPFRLKR